MYFSIPSTVSALAGDKLSVSESSTYALLENQTWMINHIIYYISKQLKSGSLIPGQNDCNQYQMPALPAMGVRIGG